VTDDPTTFAGEVFDAVDAALADGSFWQTDEDAYWALRWSHDDCDCHDCVYRGEDWDPEFCGPDCPECAWFEEWREARPSPTRMHGVAGVPAIVTHSVARERKHYVRPGDIATMKRQAHKRHRRAWRMWARDPERAEPVLRSLTSWEVW
jgi:hypothetical protein